MLNGDPKDVAGRARLGLRHRRSRRQAGRQQQAVLLLQPRDEPAHVRRRRARATAADRCSNGRATSRRSRDNLRQPVPVHQGSAAAGRVQCGRRRWRCFADGGVLGRIPANRLYQTGLNILKWWPTPNIAHAGRAGLQLRESPIPKINLLGYQPVIRVDYQPTPNLRGSFKFVEYQQPNKPDPRHASRVQRQSSRTTTASGCRPARSTGRSTRRRSSRRRRARTSTTRKAARSRAASRTSAATVFRRIRTSQPQHAGLRRHPVPVPGCDHARAGHVHPLGRSQRSDTPMWDGTRVHAAPDVRVGQPRRQRAAELSRGRSATSSSTPRDRTWNASVTKVAGSHTLKTGYYYFHSLPASRSGRHARAASTSSNDTQQPARHGFGFANAALGDLQLLRAAVALG